MTVKRKKYIIVLLFICYCLFILWYTLFSRPLRTNHKLELRLFWSFRALLAGKPYAEAEVKQYINNILFFIPFGLLFPWKNRGWKTLALSAAAFSILVELSQLIFKLGWCELDDVICNTLGALIGYCLFLGWKRIKEKLGHI